MIQGTPEVIEKFADTVVADNIEITCLAKVGPGFESEAPILKRMVTWTLSGFTWRADPKHAQALIEMLGKAKENINPSETPGTATLCKTNRQAMDILEPAKAQEATRAGGIATYLALDRPDICFATRSATKDMSAPKVRMMIKLHRLARYLACVPELIWKYDYQKSPGTLITRTDADWAGPDAEGQKCHTCVVIKHGKHFIDFICTGQKVVALSSAESEFYARATGASHGLQIKNIFSEMSLPLNLVVEGDPTSAHQLCSRIGTAKLRHLTKKDLWIQEKVEQQEMKLARVPTDDNEADLGTKYQD